MRWLSVALLAVALARPWTAAAGPWTLPDEETLVYAVKLGGWTVVNATFKLQSRERDAGLHTIWVEARTTSIPSRIYRVSNTYDTVLDVSTGLPRSYRKACDEAKFQETSLAAYDQRERRAVYTRTDAPTRRAELLAETHNLFSALYYLRRHDFDIDTSPDFHLDAKSVYWHARATKTRNLRTKHGEVWEVIVEFTRVGGADQPMQSDVLTDNIVRGDVPLTLHIRPGSGDGARPPMVVHMAYEARGFRLTAVLREDKDANSRRQD